MVQIEDDQPEKRLALTIKERMAILAGKYSKFLRVHFQLQIPGAGRTGANFECLKRTNKSPVQGEQRNRPVRSPKTIFQSVSSSIGAKSLSPDFCSITHGRTQV